MPPTSNTGNDGPYAVAAAVASDEDEEMITEVGDDEVPTGEDRRTTSNAVLSTTFSLVRAPSKRMPEMEGNV
jgi:hypothetical protein